MLVSPIPARHRAVGRPATALSDLAQTASGSLSAVGRRSAVVAAASGMLVSGLVVPASASTGVVTPLTAGRAALPTVEGSVPAVDTSSLTAAARAVIARAPVVTVAADAAWTLDIPVLSVIADPPPAPTRTAAAASRSQARAALPAAPVATGAAVPASANGSAVLEIAARYVGVPYLYGGTTPSGFDCSGFTAYVFAQVGIALPRTSASQHDAGTIVSRADAQPGDLVWHPGHIGIYAGADTMIDSPQPGGTVQFRAIYFSNPVFIRFG